MTLNGSVHELMEVSVDALEVFDLVLQCVPRMDGQDKASSLNESKIGSDHFSINISAGNTVFAIRRANL